MMLWRRLTNIGTASTSGTTTASTVLCGSSRAIGQSTTTTTGNSSVENTKAGVSSSPASSSSSSSSSSSPTATAEGSHQQPVRDEGVESPPCDGARFSVLRGQRSTVDVRGWWDQVPVEREARAQILRLASMSDVIQHPIAAMPDLHLGNGATVGAVIPMTQAIIPAAVGVDIGCGMLAVRTSLTEEDLPRDLGHIRLAIEIAVPHGRTHNGQVEHDAGGWRLRIPRDVAKVWKTQLQPRFDRLCVKYPMLERTNNINHLGTLGTGNHFIEVCLDEQGKVWVMLHTGSRGVGNKIGAMFIELAKKDMGALVSNLPDKDLAYLKEGTQHFDDYVEAVEWAQDYARYNREVMMSCILTSLRQCKGIKPFTTEAAAINCHHNYVERSSILGQDVWLTRKGATSAKTGELAIIPGSMGRASYIVKGKGNEQSYCSCSHGAGRKYSRGESTRRFTLEEHEAATQGIECRKDKDVLDETPMAYKDIDDVMKAQDDLVEVVHTLRQVVCVKG